ncbi:MAG TPA: acylneuraminate cytidylyltransferase [Rhizomicrobium sp.]|nr:acylneuraminate cytidylyltransferase [Rhizomicrobium sp.]
MTRCWAVIPARGGSKGIPRKNLKKVGGIPLVARAVLAVRAARTIERVFVSTDDEEIANTARAAGAEIVRRPADLASDSASSEAALLHALDTLESAGEQLPDVLTFVQCTSPFVRGADIDGAVERLISTASDCAITVSGFHGFVWRAAAGGLQGVNHEGQVRQRRQDRGPEFLENGAVYALRVPAFRRERKRFCGKIVSHAMPAERSLEIDSEPELEMARRIAPMFHEDAALAPVSGVVFDFDGVMTDNKVWVGQGGEELVRCDRSDGMGIENLKKLGIPVLILSKERNAVVSARAEKIGVECVQAMDEKGPALEAWARRTGLDLSSVVYVGNDVNDIPCLERVGMPVIVADAHPGVFPYARIVLAAKGGEGAVREICDRICQARSR